jgi:hypothetical protein
MAKQLICIGLDDLKLPQPLERFQNPLDLLAAFFVFAAEEGGERFGIIRSGDIPLAGGDELAEDGDLLGEAIGPGEGE